MSLCSQRRFPFIFLQFINEYECWASRWNIAVNPEKSQHATFSLNRGNTTQISLNGTRIQHRPEVKYLGIIIDRRLTWKPHILRTCATVRAKCKKLDWLLRPRSGLSLTAKVRLFKAIISPTLTWGLNIWGTACNSSIKKIESCQSKILRRIVGSPWYVLTGGTKNVGYGCDQSWRSPKLNEILVQPSDYYWGGFEASNTAGE
ncbi:hypothetical protein ACLKA6_017745 [Drosophila palustris]